MRILHIAESIRGGCGTYLNEIVPLQIEDLGPHNVRVLVPDQHVSHLARIAPSDIDTFNRPRRSTGLIFLAIKAIASIRAFRPDVLHIHSTFAGGLIRLLAAFMPGRRFIVYCPHGWVFDVEQGRVSRRIVEWAERMLSLLCDRIVAVSEYEFEAGIRIGISARELVLVENGISNIALPEEASGWRDSRLRSLFVGRLDTQKGLDILIQAASRLKEKVAVRVIGASVNSSSMQMTIPENVEMLGWKSQEEIAAQMAACDVVVIPSRWEGLSLVAVEAMRSGKAVIASDIGGLTSVVVNGVTGVLVAKNSVAELTAALVSRTRDEWSELGRAGRARFLDYYTVDRVHRQLMELYSSGLTHHDGPLSSRADGRG
jgi:glycosyltransferase involved in cell wall biosynthesis